MQPLSGLIKNHFGNRYKKEYDSACYFDETGRWKISAKRDDAGWIARIFCPHVSRIYSAMRDYEMWDVCRAYITRCKMYAGHMSRIVAHISCNAGHTCTAYMRGIHLSLYILHCAMYMPHVCPACICISRMYTPHVYTAYILPYFL